jgi:hypothetical protein
MFVGMTQLSGRSELVGNRFSRRGLLAGAAGLSLALHRRSGFASAEIVENFPAPVNDPDSYIAYVPTASKIGQFHHYSCEFDAAWAVMKTFGIDSTFEEMIAVLGIDDRIEPYYVEEPDGIFVYGGDIGTKWSGDYEHNFLSKTTGPAMRKVFKHYGLRPHGIRSRRGIKSSLDAGRPVWAKLIVDFRDWISATWVTPEGATYPVALGNDHSAIAIGYNEDVVVVRDVLGPTDSNWNRAYEYEVPWQRFMDCFVAQGKDGVAVGPD